MGMLGPLGMGAWLILQKQVTAPHVLSNQISLPQVLHLGAGSGPKNLEEAGARSMGQGRATAPSVLSNYRYRRSRSNRLQVGSQIIWGLWGFAPMGGIVANAPKTSYCPKCVVKTKFRRSTSNRLVVIMEILQKIPTPFVSPFKVTRGHWNRH